MHARLIPPVLPSDDTRSLLAGNPGEYTIKELAEKVQGLVNPAVPVAFKPLPSDDPTRRKPDITRAKQNLGWEPKVPLEKGLRLTIEDFKTRVHGHK